ncbi:DsbA family oxidoreductase [Phreatobacter cathodiphilus]|uniref:Disulfide bond formation protein DsbA n=1 Tax=Phreatobacter cathodiphilus TaxID=1868589 RepID=A0A2S0N9Y7_9HYPH|nr:DsbA family oxidoreductase [Phreatobacter cathodiphilus]AVO44965.1 disulfide bond formation protein DsbA [Phreatobacter cathodiphilus]
MADTPFPTPQTLTIDVVSDVVCPWCFVGKRRLEKALALTPDIATEIRWRPYQLAPELPPEGKPRRQYMLDKFGDPDRVRQIHERLTGIGAEEGIAFDFDRIEVAPNTLNAHRLILWARSPDIQSRVVEALFTAFFVEGRNLADDDELIAIGEACGLDGTLLAELFPTDADVERTRREYASAQRIGVTGVPFFIVAGRYGIAGAEAPETIAGAIRQAASETVA